jgi:MFS-type transporter involved in bile tolerance (Atg22 family)
MIMMVVMMLVLVIMPMMVAMVIVMAVLMMVVHDFARWFLGFLRCPSFGGVRASRSSAQAAARERRFGCISHDVEEGAA